MSVSAGRRRSLARWARLLSAIGACACADVIGADFGDYRIAPGDGSASGGASGSTGGFGAGAATGGNVSAGGTLSGRGGSGGITGNGGAGGACPIPFFCVGSGGAKGTGGSGGSGGAGGSSCGAGQKRCASDGACHPQSPQYGCDLGSACTPCSAAPANGYETCSGNVCRFDCNSGYVKDPVYILCDVAPGAGGGTGAGGVTSTGGASVGGAGGSVVCGGVTCSACIVGETPCCKSTGGCGCKFLIGGTCG